VKRGEKTHRAAKHNFVAKVVWSPPPGILYEYQNKEVAKFAIRKSLILKGSILVVWGWQRPKMASLRKRKAGASSRTPHVVMYRVKCTKE
jgi:hypothetical protein